jgi:hypothetical protein
MRLIMDSNLQERCELEFERYVAEVCNSKPDDWGIATASVPWARSGWCFTQDAIPHLIRKIRAALDAQVWFSKHGPSWAQPLPLGADYVAMIRGGGPLHLLGLYALSLEMMDYDFLAHPQFYDFCRGVMASPHSDHLRNDRELLAEFAPKPLPGLGARCWWSG